METQENDENRTLGEREAIIFSLDTAPHPRENDTEETDSFFELTEKDARIIYRDHIRAGSGAGEAPLKTAKLREAEEQRRLSRRLKLCQNSVIRIQFPNRHVLQGIFQPNETIGDVCEFVRKYLNEPQRQFHLFTTPPKKVMPVDRTLLDANCCPRATFHFGVEDQNLDPSDKYFRDEFLNRLCTVEEANVKASQSRGFIKDSPSNEKMPDEDADVNEGASTSKGAVPKNPPPFQSEGYRLSDSTSNRSQSSGQVPKWFKGFKK